MRQLIAVVMGVVLMLAGCVGEAAERRLMGSVESRMSADAGASDGQEPLTVPLIGRLPLDVGDPTREVRSLQMPPSACIDGRPPLPDGWPSEDLQVFLVCYAPPIRESWHGTVVTFDLREERSWPVVRRPLVSIPLTPAVQDWGSASQWMAAVLLVIPHGSQVWPLMNARYIDQEGYRQTAVTPNADRMGFTVRGEMRFWRITADHDHPRPFRTIELADRCYDPLHPDPELSGEFYPAEWVCPDDLAFCGPGPLHCL